MANVPNVFFNYVLVIVFLFLLNVGVSPCFHCTFFSLPYSGVSSYNLVFSRGGCQKGWVGGRVGEFMFIKKGG